MDERTALLLAVAAAPGDIVVRLAYADWLDEHGEDGSSWRVGTPPRRLGYGGYGGGGGGDGGGYGGYGGGGGGGGGDGDGGGGGGYGGYGDYGGAGGGGGYGHGYGGGGGYGSYGDGVGGGYGHGYGDGGGYGHGYGDGSTVTGDYHMPKIGDTVLLHARGSYYPYVWCGRVADVLGTKDFKLTDASLLPHTREPGVTWLGLARGDPGMREAVRVRRIGQQFIEVWDCTMCVDWVGDLPQADQH